MIFRAELIEKILAGGKTVTRRPLSENRLSPWHLSRGLVAGREYALQPGRGVAAVGTILVVSSRVERLGDVFVEGEARLEGFNGRDEFVVYWRGLYRGRFDPGMRVWRVEFEVVA